MRIWNGYQRGINFGGWFSQCQDDNRHYDTFITESDFATVAKWGVDHVRIPIDYRMLESEGGIIKQIGYERLKQCMEWCLKHHLHMVLTVYQAYGYCPEDPDHSTDFFSDPALQARYLSMWHQLAEKFGEYSEIVAFELLSDVIAEENPEKWNELASNAVSAIRSVTKNSSIIISGIHGNSADQIPNLLPPSDRNIVYGFRCFDPIIFTHQSADWMPEMPEDFHIEYPDSLERYCRFSTAFNKDYTTSLLSLGVSDVGRSMFEARLSQAMRMAEQYDVPLYCTSYGVIDQADTESVIRWYQTVHEVFESYHIGRAAWTYKGLDFGITDSKLLSIADKLIPLL